MDLLFVLNKGHVYYLWYENIGTKVYYLCYKWVYHLFIFVPYIGLLFVPYIGLIFVLYKGLIFVRNLLVISPPGEPEASEKCRRLPSFLNKNDFSLSIQKNSCFWNITSPKVLSPYFLKMSIFWQIILHFIRKTFGSPILFFTSESVYKFEWWTETHAPGLRHGVLHKVPFHPLSQTQDPLSPQ